jgi:hypothetical protein
MVMRAGLPAASSANVTNAGSISGSGQRATKVS